MPDHSSKSSAMKAANRASEDAAKHELERLRPFADFCVRLKNDPHVPEAYRKEADALTADRPAENWGQQWRQ